MTSFGEEEDSNMVSSSGSSPALGNNEQDPEVLEVLSTSPNSSSSRTVQLEPFVHQVGGHFPMACLASDIVCKPLNEREHKFYKSMSRSLVPFVPRYEGTMKVEIHEDDHGYIKFNSHPPRKFSSKRNLNHHQLLQLHLQGEHGFRSWIRSKSRSGSSITTNDDDHDMLEDVDNEDFEAGSSSGGDSEEVFCNPWALKCHREHLKKMGLLSPTTTTTTSSSSLASDGKAQSPQKMSQNLVNYSKSTVNSEDQRSTTTKSVNKRPQLYLLLENLVSKYKYPCVLDLKVGTRQYSDDVSPAKKARKIAKAANSTLATLGLRLTGMQVYSHSAGKYICQNKYFGRTLNQESFFDTIEDFFKYNDVVRCDVIQRTKINIQELTEVLVKLENYRFYTASLLVTYDGNFTKEPFVDVRIIDFAHSTHKGFRDDVLHEGPDNGFVHGLKNLVQILDEVLQKQHQEKLEK